MKSPLKQLQKPAAEVSVTSPRKSSARLAVFASALLSLGAIANADVTVTVKNELDLPRPAATIEVPWTAVEKGIPAGTKGDKVVVSDASGKDVVAQPIYFNGQKKPPEMLVFQADFGPGESKSFTIKPGKPVPYQPKVYGRWIPERLDDFAWENDKIAFRAYGPELEKVEPGSSGLDIWMKRTPEMVINKWYAMASSINSDYYHWDRGEGVDCYKVGHAQGCGGTAVWADGKRFTTGIKGWQKQKTIANGPVRLIFELTYDPIDVNGNKVSEVKRITLDAGSHMNHMECTFTADKPADLTICPGLMQHPDRKFTQSMHKEQGWMSYWDAADVLRGQQAGENGNIACGLVILPGDTQDMVEADNHLLALTKATPGKPVSFWAGGGWDKSGEFSNVADWDKYLEQFARIAQSPLKVTVSQ